MAKVEMISCDNDCGWEAVETPEARASMVQVVVTQGGSRSHVYDLCPNCASGFAEKLPDDPAAWPRYVRREAVHEWLRSHAAAWPRYDTPSSRIGDRPWRVKVVTQAGVTFYEDPVWAPGKLEAAEKIRRAFPGYAIGEPEEVSGA